jgi:Ca2+/H+ antiporter
MLRELLFLLFNDQKNNVTIFFFTILSAQVICSLSTSIFTSVMAKIIPLSLVLGNNVKRVLLPSPPKLV